MAFQQKVFIPVITDNVCGTYTQIQLLGCLPHLKRTATTSNAVNVLHLDLNAAQIGDGLDLGAKVVGIDLLCQVATHCLTAVIGAHLYKIDTTLATTAGSGNVPAPTALTVTTTGNGKAVDSGNMRRVSVAVTSPTYDSLKSAHYKALFCIPCSCTTIFNIFGAELILEVPGVNG